MIPGAAFARTSADTKHADAFHHWFIRGQNPPHVV